MKLSDYVVLKLEQTRAKFVFGVTGGGAMHLNDSFAKSKKIDFVMTHHEQSAAMMAEAYARKTKNIGICHVTTGPGGTNSITGVIGAWIDSIPMVIISGQVAKKDMINNLKIRQMGVQEVDIVPIVSKFTKYAKTIKKSEDIEFELEKALYLAKTGKPGPVWLDIPLDIQSSQVRPSKLRKFKTPKNFKKKINFKKIFHLIKNSKRPCIVIGNGLHISNSDKIFKKISKILNLPIISSWNASDIIDTCNDNYIGRIGIFGDRGSNFTIQNSDLAIILGCRLSQPQTGYNLKLFAPDTKFIYVDIDKKEIDKFGKKVACGINCDLFQFLTEFLNKIKLQKNLNQWSVEKKEWIKKTIYWKKKYSVVEKHYSRQKKINSFYFIDRLSKVISDNACIVTDMGTSFTCTMQTMNLKKNQRLFTSSGLAAMGFGLPGAIGASFADLHNQQIICISGDGGFMFNIQELQTIKHYRLPIKIFILCNKGYLTMKLMQKKNFSKLVGSSPETGISCPSFTRISKAFKIPSISLKKPGELNKLKSILKTKGPILCEIHMDPVQPLIPRLQTKMTKDGKFLPTPIDNLYPFLDEKEYNKNIFYKKHNY